MTDWGGWVDRALWWLEHTQEDYDELLRLVGADFPDVEVVTERMIDARIAAMEAELERLDREEP